MKIILPVNESVEDTNISLSFGRSPYFLVYDTDKKESQFLINDASEQTGGAGIQAAQKIVDLKPDALLTPRLGKNAAQVLQQSDLKVYEIPIVSAKEAIKSHQAGKLTPLNENHLGFYRHGRGTQV